MDASSISGLIDEVNRIYSKSFNLLITNLSFWFVISNTTLRVPTHKSPIPPSHDHVGLA